jgi:(1->4)-alpha-D-glucan 1-alpha-D-glucosylmutase
LLDVIEGLQGTPRELMWKQQGEGAKLYVIRKLLQLRRDDPELFARGEYHALQVEGTRKDHVFAFARTHEGRTCIVVVPRWTAKLMDATIDLPIGERIWSDTTITIGATSAAERLTDVFTAREVAAEGEQGARTLRVADVFAEFPVAVLRAQ